ncbi:hypothetical protein ACKKBG_A23625 [Auxenochlorella protothecoides x Auxenochlorella symbiontica]
MPRIDMRMSQRDLVQALVAELTDHPRLRCLALQGCGLDDAGADLLSRVVAFNPTLERLDLRGNAIGAQGAQLLANALRTYNVGTLRALCLEGNPCITQAPELFPGGQTELSAQASSTPRAEKGHAMSAPSPLRPLDAKVERRMLSLEHGIEEAAEQLSSVLTWRERFDVASGQMAAVLEMLQTDTEAMRTRLELVESASPEAQQAVAALASQVMPQLQALGDALCALRDDLAGSVVASLQASVDARLTAHGESTRVETAALASDLAGARATAGRAEMGAAAAAAEAARAAAGLQAVNATLRTLRSDVAAASRVAGDAYRAACEAAAGVRGAGRGEGPEGAAPEPAAASAEALVESLALQVEESLEGVESRWRGALADLAGDWRAELDSCLVAANRDVAALQVELALASETAAAGVREAAAAAAAAASGAAAAAAEAKSAAETARRAVDATEAGERSAAALAERVDALAARVGAGAAGLARCHAALASAEEREAARESRERERGAGRAAVLTALEAGVRRLGADVSTLTSEHLSLAQAVEEIEGRLVQSCQAEAGSLVPEPAAGIAPRLPALPIAESLQQGPASHPLGALSSRTLSGVEDPSPRPGLEGGSREVECLRAGLAINTRETTQLAAIVRLQAATIARLEARLDALAGPARRDAVAAECPASATGRDATQDAQAAARDAHAAIGDACATTGVRSQGPGRRGPSGGLQLDLASLGPAPGEEAAPAAGPGPSPSLATLCSAFKQAASRPQAALQLHTPRVKSAGEVDVQLASHPLGGGKEGGSAYIQAVYALTPRRAAAAAAAAKPAAH